ncbi:Crp/Fnr family transcriptional regulator [uncultured Winogradskyella sp.]|uniref:Crp/Fnr family transcriptional regulator n=1 Tax=uncultured Winogradskyella sp. TaxID=395353 RepID=UPI0026271B91|nr:Crp/Fnr family transcriptional regulator [uncultured Winogradskyella sp.]
MKDELNKIFGDSLEPRLIEEIHKVGIYKRIAAGTKIIEIGSLVRGVPLVLTGAIKVMREDNDGNELLLYYLEDGQACSMSISGCFKTSKSAVRAIAERDTELIIIPIDKIVNWNITYKSWSDFIFNSYDARFNELLQAIDNIAFNNMDQRLVEYLKDKARINNSLFIEQTHKAIAYDLNSSRVVISRLLKKLENEGAIELQRNFIKIINLDFEK